MIAALFPQGLYPSGALCLPYEWTYAAFTPTVANIRTLGRDNPLVSYMVGAADMPVTVHNIMEK
jgi:hypothetical protein